VNSRIDIIIPTVERPDFIGPLVRSLEKLLMAGDRVYVVWQGKHKPAFEENGSVRFIHCALPNLPKARNRGIAEGSNDIVLFLDDDVEVLNAEFLEAHRNAYSNANIGAVAGFVDDPLFVKGSASCSTFDETTGEIKQNFSLSQAQDTISMMGANMSMRRKAIEGISGFDERFKGNALWEEIDCAFRLRAAGWTIRYCPEAKVRHVRENSGGCRRAGPIIYTYHQFANTAYFAARHAPRVHYRSWMRFWEYRLEFISRRRLLWLRHDPLLVGAGIAGAIGGIVRYLTKKLSPSSRGWLKAGGGVTE
jgi:GT2 family glycosyltransferase